MVRKGFPILEKGLLARIIFFAFISCFIILLCSNAVAQTTDDYLENRNGLENDSYRNAAVISPGEYTGLICQDDDWYKVNVPDLGEINTANIKITIQFSHMNGDLDLALYSTKAPPNDYNFLEISGLTANEEIVSSSVPPGDYLIRAYSYQGIYNNYTMNIEILYPCQYVPYEWIDITGGENNIEMEDDDYKEIEIGFDFKFYDQVYKKVKVSSNGYLTFADRTLPYFNPNSPTPIRANHKNAPPISIFSYWMDLRPDLGGGIFYKTDDQLNPNCKKLIVEWRDIPKDLNGGGITFQAVLFECSNQILLQYNDVIFTSQNDGYSLGAGATIGITMGRKTKNSIDRISTQYLYKDQGIAGQIALMFTPSLNDPFRILSSNLIGEEIQDLSPEKQLKILFSQHIDANNNLDGSILIDPYVDGEWLIKQNRIIFDHPDDPFETSLSYKVTLLTDQIRNCFEKPLLGDGDYIFTFMFNETDTNQPLIEVSPESHIFNDVFVNEASEPLEVFIFNKGNADLNIKGITLSDKTNFSLNINGGPDPIENIPVTISSGEGRSVTIVFTPSSETEFDALLDINSNDPNNPSIFIPLYGKGIQPEPNIEVSPTSLNFENTRTGKSSTLHINISNKGNTVLNISSLNFQNQNIPNFPFALTGNTIPTENSPLTIPENESSNILIRFTPSIEDMFNTTVEIISDDPDTPKIYVSVKGRGLSVPIYDCLEPYDCLANTNITALMIDTNENLWIGTEEGGICEYNLYTGTFTCFNDDNGLAGNNVADIAVGPDGEIWVATNPDNYGNLAGVSQFIETTGNFINYDPAQMGTPYDDIEISDIVVDNNGHLWVAADSELLEFDGSYWNMYDFSSYITCLDVDSNGRLWIGTDFLGIYIKDPFINLPRSVDLTLGIIDNISDIVIDANGYLWIASLLDNKNSLLFLSPESLISLDQEGLMPESFPLPDSLVKTDQDTMINELFIQPVTDDLFIATDNGLFIHEGDIWHHFSITNSDLPSPYINSIIVDYYNDYWIGTKEGLSHFNSAAPYIVGEVCGDNHKTSGLSIDTNIFVTFSEPMDRNSTEASFQMINKDKNDNIVNGTLHWNKNSTVIKFEPKPSLAYNSNYEIRISKEAKDRAGMTIDMFFCDGTDYCSYPISTYKPEKEQPAPNPYSTQYTGFFNYYRPNYWSNYNFNLTNWSGYSVNNFRSPYWSGQSIGNSLLKIPSNNFNLQYNFGLYSTYQSIGIPQVQSFPSSNFNTWNLFSTSTYKNNTGYNNYYTDNIYRNIGNPLQGFNYYSKFYQNR